MRQALLSLGALCACLLSAQPAAASSPDWLRWAASSIRQAGVEITTPPTCKANTAALYTFSTRTITICPEAVRRGYSYVAEALAHEAVHAAQHCLGRRLGLNAPRPIGIWLSQEFGDERLLSFTKRTAGRKAADIHASTRLNPSYYMAEMEAYALEDFPNEAIQLLTEICQ